MSAPSIPKYKEVLLFGFGVGYSFQDAGEGIREEEREDKFD